MLFWHLGITCAVVFFALGARRIDYRVVLLGAILPDLIDKPIGRIFFQEQFQTSRLFAHTLLFVTVLLLSIQILLRGKTARRWFVLPIAALIHLVLDGMWNDPISLFWPLFSTTFPPDPVGNYWLEVLLRPLDHPLELLKELVGLGVLAYLYRAFGLQDRSRLREFFREGRLYAGPERSQQDEGAQP
ncbi:MAG: metal-dependent hydrolase [Actinomycetota bacterium]